MVHEGAERPPLFPGFDRSAGQNESENPGITSGWRNHPHRSERPKATAFTTRRATQRV